MPITKYLEKNAELYANDCALVELNPEVRDNRRITWKEFDLTQPEPNLPYRREISWRIFNEKANRCAHYLLERGVRRGDKVGILMMNCLEWLPIYFGILKTGALAVP
nr:acyl--CoA ligase [Treponema sp.]